MKKLSTEKLEQFMQRGWYILGDEVQSFENQFAAHCGKISSGDVIQTRHPIRALHFCMHIG